MNIEELRDFCLSLRGAEEKLPFDNKTLVFSVKGKMFCATDLEDFDLINVKCDLEEAILLREQYDDVIPGYYMNKKYWNSVKTTGKIHTKLMEEWIKNSYNLVVAGLPKKNTDRIERRIKTESCKRPYTRANRSLLCLDTKLKLNFVETFFKTFTTSTT